MVSLFQAEPKTLELRPLQSEAIDAVRNGLRQGHKRQILCAPTGFGKTEVAIRLIQEAHAKGSRVAFVCDRITLVDQTSERLSDYGIPHGVAQSANTRNRQEKIQVCSAQTIEKREYWKELDLVVIDEAHVQRKKILDFVKGWGGPVIGLTATPLTPGLNETYTNIVNATTTDTLLEQGWLAPLRIFAATPIDMQGAKKAMGEWTSSEVRKRGQVIIGDIVSEWVRMTHLHFGGPVKTLVFSADVAHGEELCQAFQQAGYDFRQSSYKDDDKETRRMVESFRRGEFVGLASVEKFVKGFDVPDVMAMIGARPYSSSLASVIQQLGRGMRIAPGKDFCLYLDHAQNMAGWYEDVCDIWENGVDHFPEKNNDKQTRREGEQQADVICSGCKFVLPKGAAVCPYCGTERRRRQTKAQKVSGRMEEVTRPGSREWQENKRWVWQQLSTLALERKGGDEVSAKRFALAQYKSLYGEWPSWDGLMPTGNPVDDRVARKVRQQLTIYYNKKGG